MRPTCEKAWGNCQGTGGGGDHIVPKASRRHFVNEAIFRRSLSPQSRAPKRQIVSEPEHIPNKKAPSPGGSPSMSGWVTYRWMTLRMLIHKPSSPAPMFVDMKISAHCGRTQPGATAVRNSERSRPRHVALIPRLQRSCQAVLGSPFVVGLSCL
jgi:hypothetical protein